MFTLANTVLLQSLDLFIPHSRCSRWHLSFTHIVYLHDYLPSALGCVMLP